MWNVAKSVEAAPITYGAADVAPKGGPRSMVIAGDQFLGEPAKFRDVDLIAVSHELPERRGKMCGPYGGGGSAGFSAPLVMLDREIVVFDRRTGQRVKTRTFTAGSDCPAMATASRTTGPGGVKIDVGMRAEANADFREVRAWLKTLLKR
jgi:hypothetical protein